MASLRRCLLRLYNFVSPGRADRELARELHAHLALVEDEFRRRGLTPEAARQAARRVSGGVEQTKELHRDARSLVWLEDVWRDVHHAARGLSRNPSFTVLAVAILAVGVGVNAAVFAVTNAVLFRGSRSIDSNDRIAYIGAGGPCCPSYSEFEDWRSQAKSFEGMGAVADLRITFSDMNGVAETSGATRVSADTFKLIGQRPIIGRDFAAFDEVPGAAPVAILSHALWQRRYGADPAILGQVVRINGAQTTVIGVMPKGFSFPQKQDLWVPLVPTPELRKRDARSLWFAFGRMREGVTFEDVRAEMDTIGRRLAVANPPTDRVVLPVVMNFQQFYFGPNAATIYGALWGAVGFVLLIACVNLANLLLARAIGRSRELSIRSSLGAGRWRLTRQLLIESVMLSALGGVCGWWIARWGVRVYELAATAPTLYWADGLLDYSLDPLISAYIIGISIGTGLLFGTVPALRLSALIVNPVKSAGATGSSGTQGRRLSALLVAGEVALAVVLLAGAGVMIRSFLKVYTADTGANTDGIVTMFLSLPEVSYSRAESQISFFDRLTPRLAALPGVESVALAWRPPTNGALKLPYDLQDRYPMNDRGRPTVSTLVISPAYFRTLGAAVLFGRDFNDTDGASGPPVAIVNQRFASGQWPGEDPLGKRLRLVDRAPGPWLTVVGVASNVVQNATRQELDPLVYVPYRQQATNSMWVLVRTSVAGGLATTLRRELHALDPNLPISLGPFTLSERLAAMYWHRGLYGVLFLIFASIALLLASVGLYGVISHSVSQRTQEIGVRMAIGATVNDIRGFVFKQGLVPIGGGLIFGLAASLGLNRLLESQLVQVSPNDPITLGGATALLLLSATLGCWIPARQAMKVDPIVALRWE